MGVELDGQYRALREEAGACARDRAFIAVRGTEAAEYLQGQITNDVEALEPGQGAYAALLDRKGRMQADMAALRVADGFLLVVEPEALPASVRHLTMYSVGRDAEVADETDSHELVSVAGPAAFELTGLPPLRAEHDHAEASIGGVALRAVRTAAGVDLIAPRAEGERLLEALSELGVSVVGEAAFEILRVESGRPRFGREMTTETIPQEAGINERAVSFTKGCYIGQETVARLHYKGKPNRHLRGLESEEAMSSGESVSLGDRELGRVGTAVLSPAHGWIALAVLRREAEPGTTVTVGEGTPARVVEPPFS